MIKIFSKYLTDESHFFGLILSEFTKKQNKKELIWLSNSWL